MTLTQVEPYAALADLYIPAGFAAPTVALIPSLFNVVFEYEWVGSTAADLGCGTGDAAMYLAENGMRVFGVDNSRAMLHQAQEIAASRGLANVEWMNEDLRTFRPPTHLDLVWCLGGTLNYLPTLADLESAVRSASDALSPQKFFICEFYTIRGLAALVGDTLLAQTPRYVIVRQGSFSYETLLLTHDYHIFMHNALEWRRSEERHMLRGFPVQAVTRLLAKYGLKLLRTLDHTLAPADPAEAHRLVLVAQKEGDV